MAEVIPHVQITCPSSASCISSRSITLQSTDYISNGNTAEINTIFILFLHPVHHRLHLHHKSPSSVPSRYLRPTAQSAHAHTLPIQPVPTLSIPVFTPSKAVPPKSKSSPPSSQPYTPSSALQLRTPSTRTLLPPLPHSLNASPMPHSSTISWPPSPLAHPRSRKRTS